LSDYKRNINANGLGKRLATETLVEWISRRCEHRQRSRIYQWASIETCWRG